MNVIAVLLLILVFMFMPTEQGVNDRLDKLIKIERSQADVLYQIRDELRAQRGNR